MYYFVIFFNFSLRTPMSNLVSLTCLYLWILSKIQVEVFSVSLSKLEKRIATASIKFHDDAMSLIVMLSSLVQFTSDLEQFRSWIAHVCFMILNFSLIATFYLTKTVNRTNKFFKIAFILLFWNKSLFAWKCWLFAKK